MTAAHLRLPPFVMSFVNNYQAPPPEDPSNPLAFPILPEAELYGPTPYDINFAYPIHEDTLQNDRLKLVPFVPAVHMTRYWENVKDASKDVYRYYPFYFSTLAQTLTFFEVAIRRNPHQILFAVIDKTRPDAEHPDWGGSLAGVIALVNTKADSLSTELAFVLVFPAFQKTHVAKAMVGLSLRYLLQLPSDSPPGLGFRRVQWTAHPDNKPSMGLAQRMGMKWEGQLRWYWALSRDYAPSGKGVRKGDPFEDRLGRDSVMFAACWDDWENGGRELVEAVLR